ncbi:MAG: class I SAM-dependent methyltransferase, partial [Gemmatimonadales bacterium]
MKRLHLFEIHDQPWCPASLRDTLTDFIAFLTRVAGLYDPVVPRLKRALERSGAGRVVDLCSGSGGPWRDLGPRLVEEG